MDYMISKIAQSMRDQCNYIHVSQYYRPKKITDPLTGTVSMVMEPQFRDHRGLPRGLTYNVGRNAFKRTCKRFGLNRVQVERRAAKEMNDVA